jgi:hypothetical protein
MRTGRGGSLLIGTLVGVLSVMLAVGPAAADPRTRHAASETDDEDDVPTPPPPPAPAPAPAPAPEPAQVYVPPAGAVVYTQTTQLQYGTLPPHLLYARGQSLRSVGLPLTLIGIALFAVSIGLLVKATQEASCGQGGACNSDAGARYAIGGVFAMLGGVAGLGVGIPLWAVGASRMNRAVQMGFVPTYARAYVAPTPGGGLVAGLRLTVF